MCHSLSKRSAANLHRFRGTVNVAAGEPQRADVFANIADPVGAGSVDSLARPGGNATGVTRLGVIIPF
jgi:hypothetical protein